MAPGAGIKKKWGLEPHSLVVTESWCISSTRQPHAQGVAFGLDRFRLRQLNHLNARINSASTPRSGSFCPQSHQAICTLAAFGTALFNVLFARHSGGEFVLRIEDTDTERSDAIYTEDILKSLQWLGFNWNEGPIFQSQRFERYQEACRKLVESGHAYYCTCTAEEVDEERKGAASPREKSPCTAASAASSAVSPPRSCRRSFA